MKRNHKKQYTIRNISSQLDRRLREQSREAGKSLNEVVLDALRQGSGLADRPLHHHDLDPLIGTWKEDPTLDEALKEQDQIDPKLWL